MNTEPQSSRYSLAAAEVLASEQSVLRLITRNTPLPELLVEVCRRAEALLGDGASCTILLLDTDGVHVHVGAAPSLPGRYSAAIEGASIGPAAGSCGTAMYLRRMVVVEDIETDPLGPTTGPSHCRWACARAGRCRSSTKRASCSARSPSITARRAGRATRKPNCCATSATASASRCQDRIARQLARSEEHHRLVVNSLNEGIVVVSRDGVVVASNPSANRMMRVKGDLVGRRLSTVILRKLHEDGTPIAPDEWPSRRALETATPMLGYTVGFGRTATSSGCAATRCRS